MTTSWPHCLTPLGGKKNAHTLHQSQTHIYTFIVYTFFSSKNFKSSFSRTCCHFRWSPQVTCILGGLLFSLFIAVSCCVVMLADDWGGFCVLCLLHCRGVSPKPKQGWVTLASWIRGCVQRQTNVQLCYRYKNPCLLPHAVHVGNIFTLIHELHANINTTLHFLLVGTFGRNIWVRLISFTEKVAYQ